MAILQRTLPFAPWMHRGASRLPGVMPAEADAWPVIDEAYAAQMAERDRLIAAVPERVHAMLPEAEPAARELWELVIGRIAGTEGFEVSESEARRPDGVRVTLDPARPLATLGRLVQDDLCLLAPGPEGHRLVAAVLCFPASWTLAQKIGRPLLAIHAPVPEYDARIAASVQRMFDAVRPGRPLFRANALSYDDPGLHQPRREGEARPRPVDHVYVRSELQTLMRLPLTGAVLFAIHTRVVRVADLEHEVAAGFLAYVAGREEGSRDQSPAMQDGGNG